jgi:membrane-associated phospholipid phosphatase
MHYPHRRTTAPAAAVGLMVLAAVVVAAGAAGEVRAQAGNDFEHVEPGLGDAAFIGVLLPLNVGLGLNPTPTSARQRPPGFDVTVRRALRWNNYLLARDLSDGFMYSLLLASAGMPLIGQWDVERDTLAGVMVGFEALLMTSIVTELAKQITARQRPNEYYSSDPTEPEHELFMVEGVEYTNRSFFSGHTSMAFASATMLTIFAYEYDWLAEDWRWVVPASAYTVAFLAGYMRMAGDSHWLSDVVVGAFVGTGTAFLVFEVRTE